MEKTIIIFKRCSFGGLTEDEYDQLKYLDIFCEEKEYHVNNILQWKHIEGRNRMDKEKIASKILQEVEFKRWKQANAEMIEWVKTALEYKGLDFEQIPVDMINVVQQNLRKANQKGISFEEHLIELEITTSSEFRDWLRANRNSTSLLLANPYTP